jgi:valyl-tRNA synthetase
MNNIRDWCVSRQIWWGHQIPAWYCECGEIIVRADWAQEDANGVSRETLSKRTCPKCNSNKLKRDEDVLDTWFSSALWPFATLGWPEQTDDLNKYYPTSFLSTARDIMHLWVARMIFSGIEFMKEAPFKDVYIHATVFNKEGERMSKSLGTGIDPLVLIEKYGTDATRFGLLWQAAQGQDMRFGEDALLMGQRFANKIWNASRFALINLENYNNVSHETFEKEIRPILSSEDKDVLEKLNLAIKKIDSYLSKYDFQHAAEYIYDFFWHEFCDKYIETAKIRIRDNSKDKLAAQYTLYTVLVNSLKLLHPFMPFVTEAIWANLKQEEPLIISEWPKANK